MKNPLRLLLCTVLSVFLLAATAFADNGLVIDSDQSSLKSFEMHVADLSGTVQPLVTNSLLKVLYLAEKDVALATVALLEAQIKQFSLQNGGDNALASLELPKGDLTLLAKGQLSADSLSKAFGQSFVTMLGDSVGTETQQLEAVAPQVYSPSPDTFYAVEGQVALFSNSLELVQAGLGKVRQGQKIVAVPDSGQRIWTNISYMVFHAPTEAGPFTQTPFKETMLFFSTDEGWKMQKKANYTDVMPALGKAAPVDVDQVPFLGGTNQNIIAIISGSLIDALSKIKLVADGTTVGADGMLPFDMKDIKRLSLVTGGGKSSVMGVDIPSFYVSLDAANTIIEFLVPMLKSLNEGWSENKIAGWDSMLTADSLNIEGTPIPVKGFIGRQSDKLVVGSASKDSLAIAQGTPDILKVLPDTKGYGTVVSLDLAGLWGQVHELMKPGAMLRSLSGIDSGNKEEVAALNALLAMPFPVKQTTQWTSPNLNEAQGVVLMGDNLQPFIDVVCSYILISQYPGDTAEGAPTLPSTQGGKGASQDTAKSAPAKGDKAPGQSESDLFEQYKKFAPKN